MQADVLLGDMKQQEVGQVGTNVSDLGKLRSLMTVRLHTYESISLFNGTKRATDVAAISSEEQKKKKGYTPHNLDMLSGAVMMMEGDIRRDNPYADFWFDQMMNRLEEAAKKNEESLASLQAFMAGRVTSSFTSTIPESTKPVVYNVRSGSRGYYKFLFAVLSIDALIRTIMLAHHLCLMDNKAKNSHIQDVMSTFRSIISAAASYRHYDVDRNDIAANNQRAQKAKEHYDAIGIVPTEKHMTGEVRNEWAPEIYSAQLRESGEASAEAYSESESVIKKVEEESAVAV